MMKPAALWIVPLLTFVIIRPSIAQTPALPSLMSDQSPVRLLRKMPLPGNGLDSFALDPVERRLYLPADDSLHILFLDTFSQDLPIPYPGDVKQLIFIPELRRALIGGATGPDETLTFLDLKTLAPIDPPISLGEGRFHYCYDPAAQRASAFNTDQWVPSGKEVTALDAWTGKIVDTISLGAMPEAVVADGNGEMFLRLRQEDTDLREMAVIDTRTLALLHRWTMLPSSASSSLVMDPVHRRLFAVSVDGKLIMINADTGEIVTSLLLARWPGSLLL